MTRFVLELSNYDLQGTLKEVAARIKELSDEYGEDKEITIDIYEEHNTFGSSPRIYTTLTGK